MRRRSIEFCQFNGVLKRGLHGLHRPAVKFDEVFSDEATSLPSTGAQAAAAVVRLAVGKAGPGLRHGRELDVPEYRQGTV